MSAAIPASNIVRRVDRGPGSSPTPDGSLPITPPHLLSASLARHSEAIRALDALPVAVHGRAGDQVDVRELLLAIFQGPSREEFHASQDDPLYEPTDRLLVKKSGKIVSHVHLLKRTVRFGSVRLPVGVPQWLGTLPEFRGQGCATALLHAADAQMREDGAILGCVRTKSPHFFRRWGWAVCGRHSFSRAKPREVLANLSHRGFLRRTGLNIRFWRHVELPALMRIYDRQTSAAFGPLDRNENYWRWLLSRKAYDQIIVALDGPDHLELQESAAPIVGYAVIRGRQVVELMTEPGHPTAGPMLLARACGDLIEHDDRPVTLHAPAENPLHRFMQCPGSIFQHQEAEQGEVLMVKMLDPERFIKALTPELLNRTREGQMSRPRELGFLVDGTRQQLALSTRGLRWLPDKLGRHYLSLNGCDFIRLLLGHLETQVALNQGRLQASTPQALETAGILFPRLPLWHPLWDDTQA